MAEFAINISVSSATGSRCYDLRANTQGCNEGKDLRASKGKSKLVKRREIQRVSTLTYTKT
ncbi:hypothetical protein AGABI1DRAFT_135291 [Agaricus bisporus var. burnettii JB137-S8]|uniref:Uncharacterized protein n=1 Tax=Agaricus bisporus var. burnettii (strain JB137-S8 / ATCC MYA-4627 / FGSC 10392) TaxID=597362 RepID=K5WRS2_AGABU|nr:uncharacterized protein AGABI1DRAFT_135291 [Agaricus bisporus var. burnettii JB137-S8]EKM73227.1 hypothetical protein AGABI1DRAFT_135291 [Agaricus bisporus var. burnettii JB137-S8]